MKKFETTDPIQKYLVSLSEDDLQKNVVEPILRGMEFVDVRDRSGSNERGKDLTAIKKDSFFPSFYAIQIKKTKLSGKIGTQASLGALLAQLSQAIKEEIHFPTNGKTQKPNKLIFITPYPMENSAMCSLENSLEDAKNAGIEIIDGLMLADCVRQYIPELLTSEQSYRSYALQNSEALPEASLALQTSKNLTMDKIFVEVSLVDRTNIYSKLAVYDSSSIPSAVIYGIRPSQKELFTALSNSKFGFHMTSVSRNEAIKNYKDLRDKGEVWPKNKDEFYQFEDFIVFNPKQMLIKLIELSNFAITGFEQKQCDKTIEESFASLQAINGFVNKSKKLSYFNNLWDIISLESIAKTILIEAEALLRTSQPVCIVGVAGAGKTTFLKHLIQKAMQDDEECLPVFLPLLKLQNYSLDGVIKYIENEMLVGGFKDSKGNKKNCAILKLVKSKKLRVHFDGLDEAGSHANNAISAIKSFHEKYPSVPIVITSRQTINLKWNQSLYFVLEPFNKTKLLKFISNWFDAEPTSYTNLKEWIESHGKLQNIIQTPLIAALLCVLYSVEVDLPDTEEELYSRRIELLLGQWDTAKGIRKMPRKRREAYSLYLMTLAYEMHSNEQRSLSYGKSLEMAERFIGELRNTTRNILIDCISRGLLFIDEMGDITFGHLTYQEHLTALYLSKHNPVAEIVKYLDLPWWEKSLEFYAIQMISLDHVVKQVNKLSKVDPDKLTYLKTLLKLSPYTRELIESKKKI